MSPTQAMLPPNQNRFRVLKDSLPFVSGVFGTVGVDVAVFSNSGLFVWLVLHNLGKPLLSIQFSTIQ